MSFLTEESGGSLKKCWNLVLEKWFTETLSLVSHWTRALVGASRNFSSVGRNFGGDVTRNLHWCCSIGSLEETALLDLENRRCRVSQGGKGHPQ
jgi:hypothetical protein